MGFLGQIGIDWRLLLAQAINFGLLVWALTKLLYRPIVARLEEFEKDMKDSVDEKSEMGKRRAELEAERSAEEADMKKRTAAIIKEAEGIADAIRGKARDEAETEVKKMISRLGEQIAEQHKAASKEYLAASEGRWTDAISGTMRRVLPEASLKDLQSRYVSELRGELEGLSDEAVGCASSPEEREDKASKDDSAASTQSMTVESGLALEESEAKALSELFDSRCGKGRVKLRFRINLSLIAGCRMAVAGSFIEHHLENDIRQALRRA